MTVQKLGINLCDLSPGVMQKCGIRIRIDNYKRTADIHYPFGHAPTTCYTSMTLNAINTRKCFGAAFTLKDDATLDIYDNFMSFIRERIGKG